MQVFVFVFLLIVEASINAAPQEPISFEAAKPPVLDTKSNIEKHEDTPALKPIVEAKEDDSGVRHKKSATTTFCVEIRPSDPHQKPYEVCESGNRIYTVPIENSVFASSSSQSSSQTFAKPVYSAAKPASSYSATSNAAFSSSSKTDANYPKGTQYGTYRSAEESMEEDDMDEFETVGNEMKEKSEDMELMNPMRSAGYGYGDDYGYGYGYGHHPGFDEAHGSATFIKFKGAGGKKKKKKNKGDEEGMGHHGIVITCQPSLAGYAMGIPHGSMSMSSSASQSGGGYPGGHYGGYNGGYRTSSPSGRSSMRYRPKYDGYGKSGGYGYYGGKYGDGGKHGDGGKYGDGGDSKSPYEGSPNYKGGGYYPSYHYNAGYSGYGGSSFGGGGSGSGSGGGGSGSSGGGSSYGYYGHESGGSKMPGNAAYPSSSYSPYYQPPPKTPYSPPPPKAPYPPAPPMKHDYNSPPGSYAGYNSAPPMPPGYSAPPHYVAPGAYRTSEDSADTSPIKTPMEMKEKDMERTATPPKHEENDKASVDQMMHSRNPGMWNNGTNMRGSSGQNEEVHHHEDMKQEHQNHMSGSNPKWAANENMNGGGGSMTDGLNKSKT